MEKKLKPSEIGAELMNFASNLQSLEGQMSILESRLSDLSDRLNSINHDLEKMELPSPAPSSGTKHSGSNAFFSGKCKIIPFPGTGVPAGHGTKGAPYNLKRNLKRSKQFPVMPLLAMPGMPLPLGIHDYRPLLQRDGLILLSWDMRMTEMGERYTAYWVTSTGVSRFYASKPLSSGDFSSARPDHKSYAAEDGIEFYGQEAPEYLVHVAPELMKRNPMHGELRHTHVEKLKYNGINVDFNYKFLLKTEKNRNIQPKNSKGAESYRAGA